MRVHGGMEVRTPLILMLLPALLAGCATSAERIEEHSATFNALDPATQRNIRNGAITEGYSSEMVFMALGKPWRVTKDALGNEVWLYRHEPVAAYGETIQAGYSRRLVYDPVKQSEDLVIEPVDEKAFPQKVAYTLRLTFARDRLVRMERIKG